MDDTKDLWIGILSLFICTALVLGQAYGMYKFGRWYERRELTAALVVELTNSYYDGYKDGKKLGYSECAYKYKNCDLEPLESGRY